MKMNSTYDYLFKLLLIGDSGCGKSSILLRYTDSMFSENFMSTIGVDFKIKNIEYDGKNIKLQIWDTAGQERFRTITSSYYRGANGIFLIFDINNSESFSNVMKWYTEVKRFGPENINIILVANKADELTEKRVPEADIKELANKLNIQYIITSAKTDMNIQKAFNMMCESMVKIPQLQKNTSRNQVTSMVPVDKKETKCCN